MVDAINIASQTGGRDLPDAAQRKTENAARQAKSDQAHAIKDSKESNANKSSVQQDSKPEDVTDVIGKAAEKRLKSLSAGGTSAFLEAAEKLINESLPQPAPNTRLRINQDEDTGHFVYQGIDVNTGDVITQFPAEEILKFLAYNLGKEGVEGIIVDEKI